MPCTYTVSEQHKQRDSLAGALRNSANEKPAEPNACCLFCGSWWLGLIYRVRTSVQKLQTILVRKERKHRELLLQGCKGRHTSINEEMQYWRVVPELPNAELPKNPFCGSQATQNHRNKCKNWSSAQHGKLLWVSKPLEAFLSMASPSLPKPRDECLWHFADEIVKAQRSGRTKREASEAGSEDP